MSTRFLIKIKDVHDQSGRSVYYVAKHAGMNYNTVSKYTCDYVVAEFLPYQVIQLAKFYGVDWRDPAVVEVIETDDAEENQTALLATA